jgi:hypothetical protein
MEGDPHFLKNDTIVLGARYTENVLVLRISNAIEATMGQLWVGDGTTMGWRSTIWRSGAVTGPTGACNGNRTKFRGTRMTRTRCTACRPFETSPS